MLESIWGILSHRTFVPRLSIGLHGLMILWSGILLFRHWQIRETTSNLLIAILGAYVGFFLLWHYKKEIDLGFQHYAVTGRYLLPVIGTLQTLMLYYVFKIRSLLIKRLTITIMILVYFTGGLWMFLSRYDQVFSHWRTTY